VVLSGAFDAAFRQLKKLVAKQQGQVKSHPQQENVALVTRLNTEAGCGFITTQEGAGAVFSLQKRLERRFRPPGDGHRCPLCGRCRGARPQSQHGSD